MSCDEIQVYQIPEVCFECDREAYVMCLVPCSIHACVCYDCIFVFWFAFLCIRMTSNPLRGCHCTGSFTVTLLLRTIRMHSQSQRSSLKGGSAVRRLNQPKPKTYFCREARGVHSSSAVRFVPCACRLPYYCAPLVCFLNGLGGLAVRRCYKQTKKERSLE